MEARVGAREGGRWWRLRRWGGCGRREMRCQDDSRDGSAAGLLGCPVPGNYREDFWSPEMYPHPDHEVQNVPEGNMRGREDWVGSLNHTLTEYNVLNPWAAIRCLLHVWYLEAVDVPVRIWTWPPAHRGQGHWGKPSFGVLRAVFLNGTRVSQNPRDARTQWQVGTPRHLTSATGS